MDNGEMWALEEECEDITRKLQNIILQEKQNTPQDETRPATAVKEKRKVKRKNRKNKKKKDTSENDKKSQTSKPKRRRRPPQEDRWFGRFHCKLCNRTWESAYVFTRAGTKHVLYKQRCKTCRTDEAWYNPFALELIMCSLCLCQPCECECDRCGALKRPRFVEDPETGDKVEDTRFDYCNCDDDGYWVLGDVNDERKPHLSYLCGRCLRGKYCRGRLTQEPPVEPQDPRHEEQAL